MSQDQGCGETCCSLCVTFILIVSLTSLGVWLSLYSSNKPQCSIQYFYVPALNQTLDSRLNTTLNFMVRLDNPNRDHGIYYDDVNISLSNKNSSALVFVTNYTVPRFYQGHQKKAKKWGQVLPLNNQTIFQAVFPNGSAVFRLDLKTQVRFKFAQWKVKRHRIEVGADVEVNGNGVKANKKGIKMKKSDSSFLLRCSFPVCVLINMLIFFAIR